MIVAALLALAAPQAAAPPPPEVRVLGPGKPNEQTPATLMIEPAALFIVACDSDGDGRTTRAELDACVERSFAAIDTGHTGKLGYLAYADWQRRWLGDQGALPSPLEVDRDGDNRIALTELQAHFAKLFARFDKDHDGAVTRAEALTIRAFAADGHDPREGGPRGRHRGPPPGSQRVPGGHPGDDTPDE